MSRSNSLERVLVPVDLNVSKHEAGSLFTRSRSFAHKVKAGARTSGNSAFDQRVGMIFRNISQNKLRFLNAIDNLLLSVLTLKALAELALHAGDLLDDCYGAIGLAGVTE